MTDEEICKAFATEPESYDELILSASSGRPSGEESTTTLLIRLCKSLSLAGLFRRLIACIREPAPIRCVPDTNPSN